MFEPHAFHFTKSIIIDTIATLATLKSSECVCRHLPVLLLKLPEFSVNIESATKVRLPLLVSVLRQIAANKVHDKIG